MPVGFLYCRKLANFCSQKRKRYIQVNPSSQASSPPPPPTSLAVRLPRCSERAGGAAPGSGAVGAGCRRWVLLLVGQWVGYLQPLRVALPPENMLGAHNHSNVDQISSQPGEFPVHHLLTCS